MACQNTMSIGPSALSSASVGHAARSASGATVVVGIAVVSASVSAPVPPSGVVASTAGVVASPPTSSADSPDEQAATPTPAITSSGSKRRDENMWISLSRRRR